MRTPLSPSWDFTNPPREERFPPLDFTIPLREKRFPPLDFAIPESVVDIGRVMQFKAAILMWEFRD
ncbi:MAG: hypothetical protein DMG15_05815 [Acidobacteria bacterium]|nr:MAG: hypothetical protein DMG16_13860 [Acidobacteriota bacterium]PYS15113.1 MAG: hypothetical protein DMG15_05815 [Acidobacteriota bacterium]